MRDLSDFLERFPNAEWLEDLRGCSRWSNGEEEGSEHESEWFDENEDLCDRPD